MDLLHSSIHEIANAVKAKTLSALEVTKFFSARAEKLNSRLNAYVILNEKAEEEARAVDQKIAKGESVGPLAGVPIAIKDMLCTKNLRTTACSKILSEFIPPYDATLVERLKNNGAIVLGKTNQDEFAMGSSTETSFFGPCRNPWDTRRVPGGSSGGSAAAQAARMCAVSIGTDTGGSLRQPESFCSVVGVKPTYGRVSRFGIIAFASSLDQAGPFANSVADAAQILNTICGRDRRDSTTASVEVPDFAAHLESPIRGKKVGLIREYDLGILSEETRALFLQSQEHLRQNGAEFVEISIPHIDLAVAIYYLVATCEASSNLARYDGVKYGYRAEFPSLSGLDLDQFYARTRAEGFGEEVRRRIMLGTYALSSGYYDAYYNKACQVRRLLRQSFIEAFAKCDAILSPVTTSPAFTIGERIYNPLEMYLNDIFTTSTNLAGLPGMSVPAGFSKEGLPIGMQLTAAHFREDTLLNFGRTLEKSFSLTRRLPDVI
jgi:aspartyl-tRNA(Asn)/glutamyl-tRNA(Gln) amidotransferase subunit A